MSDIYLTRKIFTDKSTIGKLIMGDLELWTLEDTMRRRDLNGDGILQEKEKVWAITAIPAGNYKILIHGSTKFNQPMPYLQDVPYFSDIMIHWGNFPENTEGCILVGKGHTTVDKIDESRKAFDLLYPKIETALQQGPLWIHVVGGYTVEEYKKVSNG